MNNSLPYLTEGRDRALDHGRDLRLVRHVAGDADRLKPGGKGILRKLTLFGRSRVAKNALIVAEMFSVLIRLCVLDDRVIRDPSDSMIKAVIFDMDGTLVDSVDLHARAWQETFREFGKHIPFQEIRMQIGKGRDQSKIR
ncbi:unnamed protein product [uncultured bacterium]|nr:unnamed protein product [uncultured bacterium]